MPREMACIVGHPLRHWPVVHGISCAPEQKRGLGVAPISPDVVRCGADPEEERKGLPPATVPATGSGTVFLVSGRGVCT